MESNMEAKLGELQHIVSVASNEPMIKKAAEQAIRAIEELSDNKELEEAAKLFSGKMRIAENFAKIQPVYFDEAGIFWLWHNGKKCWKMVDETELLNFIFLQSSFDTTKGSERSEILQALKQIGRMFRPKEMPKSWIQFKDTILDLQTGKEFAASSEYFTVNPLAYNMHEERYTLTPTMDKLFIEWVGDKYAPLLYEIIAFSCLSDYPLHRLFCLIGSGMNGKSCFLRLLRKFLGEANVTTSDLDALLGSRFEVTKLHKKLVCMMGETNFNQLQKTSLIKKLTGQDVIGFEYKHKTPFEGENYAKILIATNNLPETTDKTDGFYRRWLIIDFPNQFDEGRDVLLDIPEEEYECLAAKIPLIIKDILVNRKFTAEGSIEERRIMYESKSNPFENFWKDRVDDGDPNAYITKNDMVKKYNAWAKENKFRELSDETIARSIVKKGVVTVQPMIEWWQNDQLVKRQVRSWGGIRWK